MNTEDTITEREPEEPRAKKCEVCEYPLLPYNPGDTSTWRTDNFCSARCKRINRKPK